MGGYVFSSFLIPVPNRTDRIRSMLSWGVEGNETRRTGRKEKDKKVKRNEEMYIQV